VSLSLSRFDLDPDLADDVDDAVADFLVSLAAVKSGRAGRAPRRGRIDGARLAAAYKARALAGPDPAPMPKRRAPSGEACRVCGIPGARGCDHFLPFAGQEA
jgi:hypothetical protein